MSTKYTFEWKIIDKNQHTKMSFYADNIEDAVKLLVDKIKENGITPVDIELVAVSINDEDLGLDGILDAEIALQKFY